MHNVMIVMRGEHFCDFHPLNETQPRSVLLIVICIVFLAAELQGFIHHGRPMPRSQVVLCFGDEFPDPQRQSKMITAQVKSV